MGRKLQRPSLEGGFDAGTANNVWTTNVAGNFTATYVSNSSTTGDARASYNKLWLKGGTAQGGDAVRAYALTTTKPAALHGIHATAEVNAGTGVTGEAAGVRATVASATGLTLSGGTYAPLRLDSSLKSALGATDLSWIYTEDLETNKIGNFLNMAVADTDTMYISAGTSANSAGKSDGCAAQKVLKCKVNGATVYIPVFTQNS
jgi:hypothetical protein